MTTNDSFDQRLANWLAEDSAHRVPEHLDEVLVLTRPMRQRAWWSSPERWLPVDIAYRARVAPIPRPVWALGMIGILLLAALILLMAGVGQRRLPHFGAAANGNMVFVDGGTLKAVNADGANVRTLAALPEGAERLAFSPDGTRLAYGTTGTIPSIVVTDPEGSHQVIVASGAPVDATSVAWSPDSGRLAFTSVLVPDKIGTIDVVDADGSDLHQLIEGPAAAAVDRFAPAWSPDGQWISFLSSEADGYVGLNVMHLDGSQAHRLATSPMYGDALAVAWSPDPRQNRLLYVAGAYVKMFDLATSKETAVGTGFWPTWSPDGERIAWWGERMQAISVAGLLAGTARPVPLFPTYGRGNCGDHPEFAGKTICGPAQWSPDGRWVYAPDIVGKAILIARSDGTGHVRSITLDHPLDAATDHDGLVTWQAVAP
jgi:hypothetical protein